jgi:2-iminoacetate synthase
MTIQAQPPLTSFADWVRANDDHAAHRLPLMGRVESLLSGEEQATRAERLRLATQLERWRYQHLAHRARRFEALDQGLVEALDLAQNELAGRPPRSPRRARGAIGDTSLDSGPLAEAVDCLDSGHPLERLAERARRMTVAGFASRSEGNGRDREARRMLLYAPLYLSSHCINYCTYCGFRYPNEIPRRHLSVDEALVEARRLTDRGFRHILLVAGDFPSLTGPEYYARIIGELTARGVRPAVEIAPQPSAVYGWLAEAGACGVTLYQETYDESLYEEYHPRGSKGAFDWRLEGLERAAEAGIGRLGLGVLLGLADPHQDLLALMRHGRYLGARFPEHRLAFSLPRIYEAPHDFRPPYHIDDETFVRFYCALRIAFPRAELVLSTREPERLRNRLAKISITQMSAGSRTTPGGYERSTEVSTCGQQFPVSDRRTPEEVARWLEGEGFSVAWEIAGRPHFED